MKNRLKKITIVLSMLITTLFSAQNYPLNTYYKNYPNYSHFKDLDNELTPYEGTYKATFNGKETTLYITKVEDRFHKRMNRQFYRDALVVKYIVKDANGNVLQDTENTNNTNIYIYSYTTRPNQNQIILVYSGTNCRVGWGKIYLSKINDQQISWEYRPNSMIITNDNCPGNPDLTVYLPVTKGLIFTKQ